MVTQRPTNIRVKLLRNVLLRIYRSLLSYLAADGTIEGKWGKAQAKYRIYKIDILHRFGVV